VIHHLIVPEPDPLLANLETFLKPAERYVNIALLELRLVPSYYIHAYDQLLASPSSPPLLNLLRQQQTSIDVVEACSNT
jgi:hypothetical protein